MKLLWPALIALAAAFPAVPSAAADDPTQLDRFYLRLAAGPRDLARMADCQINRDRENVLRVLEVEQIGPEYQEAAEALFENAGNCLFVTWSLRTTDIMWRGALAERLIAKENLSAPVRSTADLSPGMGGNYEWTWKNLEPEDARRSIPLAQCLLEQHGERVEAILDTRQTSNGERNLFNAMNSEIRNCIPAGETRTLQPQILRAALAISYYMSARAAEAGGGGSELAGNARETALGEAAE